MAGVRLGSGWLVEPRRNHEPPAPTPSVGAFPRRFPYLR